MLNRLNSAVDFQDEVISVAKRGRSAAATPAHIIELRDCLAAMVANDDESFIVQDDGLYRFADTERIVKIPLDRAEGVKLGAKNYTSFTTGVTTALRKQFEIAKDDTGVLIFANHKLSCRSGYRQNGVQAEKIYWLELTNTDPSFQITSPPQIVS
jgi:hypothetical protein